MSDIWILDGGGRVGRGVVAVLAADGVHPVLAGRDAERLGRPCTDGVRA